MGTTTPLRQTQDEGMSHFQFGKHLVFKTLFLITLRPCTVVGAKFLWTKAMNKIVRREWTIQNPKQVTRVIFAYPLIPTAFLDFCCSHFLTGRSRSWLNGGYWAQELVFGIPICVNKAKEEPRKMPKTRDSDLAMLASVRVSLCCSYPFTFWIRKWKIGTNMHRHIMTQPRSVHRKTAFAQHPRPGPLQPSHIIVPTGSFSWWDTPFCSGPSIMDRVDTSFWVCASFPLLPRCRCLWFTEHSIFSLFTPRFVPHSSACLVLRSFPPFAFHLHSLRAKWKKIPKGGSLPRFCSEMCT